MLVSFIADCLYTAAKLVAESSTKEFGKGLGKQVYASITESLAHYIGEKNVERIGVDEDGAQGRLMSLLELSGASDDDALLSQVGQLAEMLQYSSTAGASSYAIESSELIAGRHVVAQKIEGIAKSRVEAAGDINLGAVTAPGK